MKMNIGLSKKEKIMVAVIVFLIILLTAQNAKAEYIGEVNVSNFPTTQEVTVMQPVDVNPVTVQNIPDHITVTVQNLENTTPIEEAAATVATGFFYCFAAVFGIFAVMEILRKMLIFVQDAFESKAIQVLERGGIWERLWHKDSDETIIAARLADIANMKSNKKDGDK